MAVVDSGTAVSATAGHDFATCKIVDPSGDNFGGAADTWGDVDCLYRAVFRTGTALHAGIVIIYCCLVYSNSKDAVGTDDDTVTATYTGFLIQIEGGDFVDIAKVLHVSCLGS